MARVKLSKLPDRSIPHSKHLLLLITLFVGAIALVLLLDGLIQSSVYQSLQQFAFWIGDRYQQWFTQHQYQINHPLALIGLAFFYQHLWASLLLIGLLGAFASLVGIPMQTTIQQETPEAMRGKVFGLQNNAINIALSLPLVLAGVSETLFGLRVVFLALAALTIAGATLTWYISRTTIFKPSS